jgi:hypothetical protein
MRRKVLSTIIKILRKLKRGKKKGKLERKSGVLRSMIYIKRNLKIQPINSQSIMKS